MNDLSMESINLEEKDLIRLKDIKNHKFVIPDSRVKGWSVFSKDKKNIGIVNEIIVEPESKKVRYVEIYINSDIRTRSGKRHLTIPVNKVQVDINKKIVYLTNVKTVTSIIMLEPKSNYKINNDIKVTNPVSRKNGNGLYESGLFDESESTNLRENRLCKLKEFDISRLTTKNPDIRGWIVSTSDNINIGKVDELFIDREINKIRYIDIKIDEGPIFNRERHILVPIGLSVLNDNSTSKIVLKMDVNEFINYPEYKGEIVTKEYEAFLLDLFNGKIKYDHSEEYPEFFKDNHVKDQRSLQ